MSATRLLVLGIVRGYGRAHGYRIGNDLLSWGADEWANVKWGSIYHALRSLTEGGFLLDHNDIPGRTEYELTERGETEFMKLLRDALRRPQPRPDALGAALAMLPSLPREEAIALLRERLGALEAARDKARAQVDALVDPPHVRELFGMWEHSAATSAEWTRGVIERLEGGAYPMAGEPRSPGKPGGWHALKFPPYPPRDE
ncbi:PadR family transcriptional regulator [Pseudonocardia cypriaca]|jgi:DNA-binding PadR family transcriptional regulator|uniref:DNA-binding PadR family transcriptional regulator n=1 Tax=Pseudonocardia cypriaca TaxID=882449 RepID=A0A543GHI3_9PSEU|nr:PadR family transcriptional regulator [Pseudonocardia cypriaca]TQM45504.1 DNA-binding PadR family transcriptional regulator [Pseudonocardia cypriaca]